MTIVEPDGSPHVKWTWWQTFQSAATGIVLLVVANMWTSYNKTVDNQNDQTKQLIVLQVTQNAMLIDLASIKNQISSFNQLTQSLARVEVQVKDNERRINDVEQTKLTRR